MNTLAADVVKPLGEIIPLAVADFARVNANIDTNGAGAGFTQSVCDVCIGTGSPPTGSPDFERSAVYFEAPADHGHRNNITREFPLDGADGMAYGFRTGYVNNGANVITSLMIVGYRNKFYPGTNAVQTQGEALVSDTVWVVNATRASQAEANGLEYVPFLQSSSTTAYIQFTAAFSGTLELQPVYYMSVADTGDVELRLDSGEFGEGDDPTAVLSVGTVFAVTPGNDTLVHRLTGEVNLRLPVVKGSVYRLQLVRPTGGGGDTHTGDFRLLEVAASRV